MQPSTHPSGWKAWHFPVALVLQITLAWQLFHPASGWRDTTPNPNTKTPSYRFLFTHRNGDDVFCDMVFAIQLRQPEKYDHNFEFYKYISHILWLKPSDIVITKGKTKFFKRLRFINPNKKVDINYYRAIFTRLHKEFLSPHRIFQYDETPHEVFPVSSTTMLYGILSGRSVRPARIHNPRIALVAPPQYFTDKIFMQPHLQEDPTTPTKKTTKFPPTENDYA
ncbi:hypothetical protein M8J76_003614 [Diaphorina citri]|nr:hypothetical protein M8J76_003614 [Diaphorina citri]